MGTTPSAQPALIEGLLRPEAYPHAVSGLEVLETHISWVILTGRFAYKIKKPLKLDFLDFSTPARRRRFCEDELRLNRLWAPELYLEVVPICRMGDRLRLGGDGDVVDHALKMRQFRQDARLDHELAAGRVDTDDMRRFAASLADRHAGAAVLAFADADAAMTRVARPMADNFTSLEGHADGARLARLRDWTNAALARRRADLVRRHADGFVREVHGDLHLANLVRLESGIAAFDCVEFDVELRTIDVLSDVAFLVMDLVARGRPDLAFAFLNRYLECAGDYDGMIVFDLYFVYHCLIRAKVAAIRSDERHVRTDRQHDVGEANHYCDVALAWIDRPRPRLVAMHGYSGSGKTWLSDRLMLVLPAIRLRSDIERKREHGLAEGGRSESGVGAGLYTERTRAAVYVRLFEHAARLLDAGFDVIIDASFLARACRDACATLAGEQDGCFAIVSAQADRHTLQRRLRERAASGEGVSEADVSVLDYQYATRDPLTDDELAHTIRIAGETEGSIEAIAMAIGRLCDAQDA